MLWNRGNGQLTLFQETHEESVGLHGQGVFPRMPHSLVVEPVEVSFISSAKYTAVCKNMRHGHVAVGRIPPWLAVWTIHQGSAITEKRHQSGTSSNSERCRLFTQCGLNHTRSRLAFFLPLCLAWEAKPPFAFQGTHSQVRGISCSPS
jgi:hypothetical protein